MDDYLRDVAVPQVRELLTNYGPDTPAIPWWNTPYDMTAKRGGLFLHVYRRPDNGRITLPFSNKITRAYLLATPAAALTVADKTIALPDSLPDPIATVVAVEIAGEPEVTKDSIPGKGGK
ncbi:MAG: hypothetical protein NTW21_35350 [Verrucomicrobia bacterium]|nr:hypothetical protein [Verrucomicrobiota bacterium]